MKIFLLFLLFILSSPTNVLAAARIPTLDEFVARPPIHIQSKEKSAPFGLSPSQIKRIYHLPDSGGQGTIAIVDAYDYPTAEYDLNVFSQQFNLPECTQANKCFEQVLMTSDTKSDSGWAGEAALDIEWAHAIAPQSKILLVEAKTASGKNLLAAVDYARKRDDVVAISLSWGGPEFPQITNLGDHFTSPTGKATFFASSGDNGTGVEWPAVSPNVVAVGGTSLSLASNKSLKTESAWRGSGGGLSKYVTQPDYQKSFGIPKSKTFRAVPDVSYNADPKSGYSVYISTGQKGWMQVGGTSAGAPQWAAIQALGLSANNSNFYRDAKQQDHKKFFRDINKGLNGLCLFFCQAKTKYDYVTGLGSPQTISF